MFQNTVPIVLRECGEFFLIIRYCGDEPAGIVDDDFNYLYITCEDFSCKCIFSLIVHEHIVNLVKHLELYVKFP